MLDTFDFDRYRFNSITIERPSERLCTLFHGAGYVLIKEIPGLDCFYIHGAFMPSYKANLFAFYDQHYLTLRWW